MSLAAPLASENAPASTAAPTSYAPAPLIIALAALALGAFAPAVLKDGDTFSHIATGEWILAHHAAPHADPFSFSFAGAPWTAHEWLSEVILALSYRVAGFAGVMLLTGLAAGYAAYVIAERVVSRLAGPAGLALSVIAVGMIAPMLLARPHILALPCLVAWTAMLMDAREAGWAPPLKGAAIMLLWANLHGGFIFGLALIFPFALDGLMRAEPVDRPRLLQRWGLLLIASLAAALATPFGVEGLLFPFKLLGNAELGKIGEWRPEDFSHLGPFAIFLLGLLGLALVKPLRLDAIAAALIVGLVYMALQHSRHELLVAVVAPMLLAKPIQDALQPGAVSAPAGVKLRAIAAAAALLLAGGRLALPPPNVEAVNAPVAALASVSEALREKPVLNGYGFGGYLIFAHVRPFIDGRADMFGADFMAQYRRIASGDPAALEEALKRYDIAWTMFPPSQGAVAELDREPGWRRLYADAYAVVHVRDGALASGAGLRGD